MTKKHFIALADELKYQRAHFVECYGQAAFDEMVYICVQFCRAQNHRFSTDTFEGYVAGECGPCGGKIKAKSAE